MAATLKANSRMMGALAVRQLEGKIAALRARIEADPARPFLSNLESAEQKLFHLQYDQAAQAAERVRELLDDREEKARARADAVEQDAHLAERGIETDRSPDKLATRDGWLWLTRKQGRLTSEQKLVGNRWAADYRTACAEPIRSCLDDGARPTSPALKEPIDAFARRWSARSRLKKARDHIASAMGSARLADLLDAVCGEGRAIRELAGNDTRRADVTEAELRIALDMAAVSYGMKR